MKVCSVDGCNKPQWAKTMCRLHYRHMHETGRLELLPRPSTAERLAARLIAGPNGCLEWTGATNKGPRGNGGYGLMSVDSKRVYTHRLAWELVNGRIPEGLEICHTCDNRICANVEHMFLGTRADNLADMTAKGRRGTNGYETRTRCPQGHPYDEANTLVYVDGRRACRTCRRIQSAACRAKNKAAQTVSNH